MASEVTLVVVICRENEDVDESARFTPFGPVHRRERRSIRARHGFSPQQLTSPEFFSVCHDFQYPGSSLKFLHCLKLDITALPAA